MVGQRRFDVRRGLWKAIVLVVWLGEGSGLAAWAAPAPGAAPALAAPIRASGPDPGPSPASAAPPGLGEPVDPAPHLPTGLRLPDLRTLPPADFEIRSFSRGRRELRLANTVWNSGQGPLELLGQLNPRTQRTTVHQRLFALDDTHHTRLVGEFVWHPTHDHWHFEDFAVYELWSLTAHGELDRLVASSTKLSYCLIDTDAIDQARPGFEARRHYQGCGRLRQGLSVGWGDKYDSFLDGQSLDVSELADAVYGLVSTANPNARLIEADYTNNSAVIYLRIAGDRVDVALPPELDPGRCRADGWC